jgi:hypothetical protein
VHGLPRTWRTSYWPPRLSAPATDRLRRAPPPVWIVRVSGREHHTHGRCWVCARPGRHRTAMQVANRINIGPRPTAHTLSLTPHYLSHTSSEHTPTALLIQLPQCDGEAPRVKSPYTSREIPAVIPQYRMTGRNDAPPCRTPHAQLSPVRLEAAPIALRRATKLGTIWFGRGGGEGRSGPAVVEWRTW